MYNIKRINQLDVRVQLPKTIVSGKGKEVSFDHVLSQIRMMQENPTIQSRLHEEMITGSSLDIHRDEDSLIYFKWKKEL